MIQSVATGFFRLFSSDLEKKAPAEKDSFDQHRPRHIGQTSATKSPILSSLLSAMFFPPWFAGVLCLAQFFLRHKAFQQKADRVENLFRRTGLFTGPRSVTVPSCVSSVSL